MKVNVRTMSHRAACPSNRQYVGAVAAVPVVVMPTVVLAVFPEGGVTGWGRVRLTPVGVLPTQAAEKATGELNSLMEFTITLVEVLRP